MDRYTAIPGHDEMAPMLAGLLYSYLAGDVITATQIKMELERMGASGVDAVDSMAVIAANMLVDAAGSTVKARHVAARNTERITRREAGAVAARNAT